MTLCPGLVTGPQLQAADNVAGGGVKDFLHGGGAITEHQTGFIDVRDLAQAHVNAIKIEEALNQRYLLVRENGLPIADLAGVLFDHYGKGGNGEFPKAKNPKDKVPRWILACIACCSP